MRLRAIGREMGKTVAQVVINWTIDRPGITTALCGAKRPEQLRDNAGALGWRLSPAQCAAIDQAIAARGQPHRKTPCNAPMVAHGPVCIDRTPDSAVLLRRPTIDNGHPRVMFSRPIVCAPAVRP